MTEGPEKTLAAALRREHGGRVLSVQSHVVHGYAGNKCAVLPLQLHGYDVSPLFTVHFSNHTGYGFLRGDRLNGDQLRELYKGLSHNNLTEYTHVLAGYCGEPGFLSVLGEVVADLKAKNPNLKFVCDPVMGDNGAWYVPKELLPVYLEKVVPLADTLTPNAFELQLLSGLDCDTEELCRKAIQRLHARGPTTIVVTSGVPSPDPKKLVCLASRHKGGQSEAYRFSFTKKDGIFVGTGDVFAALLLTQLDENQENLAEAVHRTLASVQALIKKTSQAIEGCENPTWAQRELKLVAARADLLIPPEEELREVVVEKLTVN